MYQGLVVQESTITLVLVTKDSDGKPTNADALPTFRVYGPSGSLGLSGTCSLLDAGTVTGATNASPVVLTSAGHGLSSGSVVTITGVGGNTAANTTAAVTRIDADTFSVAVAGNGAYAGGGAWNLAGCYKAAVAATGANGFAAGNNYEVVTDYAIGAAPKAELDSFTVV